MNVLSIDLESWVHKYHLEDDSAIKKKKDSGYIRKATTDILNLLDRFGIKTTFFIISEVFDWDQELIYGIRKKGHELAFHTHTHRILVNKSILLEELKAGKRFIDEFDVKGFRAPQALIREDYLQVLRDWGFEYDSSIYYRFELFEPVDGLLEAPISTFPLRRKGINVYFPRNLTFGLMAREIPFGSGYYIGIFGSKVGWFIKRVNKRNVPASLFIHPWQITAIPDAGRDVKGGLTNRMKMLPYAMNRRNSFITLLNNHNFVPMARVINTYGHDSKNPNPADRGESH